ncbi:unnamed protein product [Leuciscus chuanchicus]
MSISFELKDSPVRKDRKGMPAIPLDGYLEGLHGYAKRSVANSGTKDYWASLCSKQTMPDHNFTVLTGGNKKFTVERKTRDLHFSGGVSAVGLLIVCICLPKRVVVSEETVYKFMAVRWIPEAALECPWCKNLLGHLILGHEDLDL